ncbi:MAG TPA: two-component system VirA-like sensor kinase, partial [Caulobacteraceae bacterium]|nr:two-component system VirA-like sensor kinase [Caulobacteraceae bacterium]
MRVWAGAAGIVLLLLLLTALLLRGIDTRPATYTAALTALEDFQLADASLHRDVLQSRAGLLRDYDSLGAATDTMRNAAKRLRVLARREGLSLAPIDRLDATVREEERLVERFKTSNALLQNSLSYVGLLSTGPAFVGENARWGSTTGALAAAILELSGDTTPASVQALQRRIDQFAARAPRTGEDAEEAEAMLAHARLLKALLPAVHQILKALVAVPSDEALQAARTMFSDQQLRVEIRAQHSRLLLYATSVLLLVLLTSLGLQLRDRAVAQRRRAEIEHVIAANSTLLINCPPGATEARVKRVIGALGRTIGADRAYVVRTDGPGPAQIWSANGAQSPEDWPAQAPAVFDRLTTTGPGVINIPDVAALPPGEARDALIAGGVSSWLCVPFDRSGRAQGVMAFDAFKKSWTGDFPGAVVRLAGDAVANAIEREFLERDRVRLTARLERARRMQAIGALASGIAHNFNNIIAAILGYSEIIEAGMPAGSTQAQQVDEIRRAAERGRELIDNILAFGRQRDARIEPVHVRALFEETASLLRASLPADVELVTDEVASDMVVLGEPALLQQVILNLSTNAAQAMDGGGRIQISARRTDADGALALTEGDLPAGRFIRLIVIDNGRGFDQAVARRLFEPFFTTRPEGTGLGLATVQEIVRDHEGEMDVLSTPGRGSRFEAWLPAAPSGVDRAPPTQPIGQGEVILVLEAERERLLQDEETLAALGFEPVGFEDAEDAFAAFRAEPERFDAAIVSQGASVRGGLTVARMLHEAAPSRPILLAA